MKYQDISEDFPVVRSSLYLESMELGCKLFYLPKSTYLLLKRKSNLEKELYSISPLTAL